MIVLGEKNTDRNVKQFLYSGRILSPRNIVYKIETVHNKL